MQLYTNPNYPNRLELYLGIIPGPIASPFDPVTYCPTYVNGVRVTMTSSTYDTENNRYLMFYPIAFNSQVVQVICSMPNPPFMAGTNKVPAFALLATPHNEMDVQAQSVGVAVQSSVWLNQLVPCIWNASNVPQFQITCSNGYTSAILDATSAAGVVYAPGIPTSGYYTATITALDASGNPIKVNGSTLTSTASFSVQNPT